MSIRLYLREDKNNYIDLAPDDTIQVVPDSIVAGKIQWDGSNGRARWRVDYWDSEERRMRCKTFPVKTYGNDAVKAKVAAEEFHATTQSVAKDCISVIRASDINNDIIEHFRYVPRGVDYPETDVPLDPYFLGLWLGDGTAKAAEITKAEPELLQWMKSFARSMGWTVAESLKPDTLAIKLRFSVGCLDLLRRVDQIRPKLHRFSTDEQKAYTTHKHIPRNYLENGISVRSQLLAGLIDTDGSLCGSDGSTGWEILQKSESLIREIKLLAESLGFFTYLTFEERYAANTPAKNRGTYGRLIIYATRFTPEIPQLVTHKRWIFRPEKEVHYPTMSFSPPSTQKRIKWTEEMDSHLLAVKGNYARGDGTDWKGMEEKEELFHGLGTGRLRGRYYDLTKAKSRPTESATEEI